jgi:hypothetical protein
LFQFSGENSRVDIPHNPIVALNLCREQVGTISLADDEGIAKFRAQLFRTVKSVYLERL